MNVGSGKKVLLVARESAVGTQAMYLLQHLFSTLIRDLPVKGLRLPDFRNVVDVYENPSSYGAKVISIRGGKAVLVQGEDCDVLLSLGSARKLDEKGDNAFVEALAGIIETGEYSHVVTTSISRLCRSTIAASRLQGVLQDFRVALLIGGQEIKVWTRDGQLHWMFLTWFAEFEAYQIEVRLLAGKLSRLEAGQWTLGFAPPPGWTLDGDKRVILDPEVAEAVRWVVMQVNRGRTDFGQLAREVAIQWPDLPARRGSTINWLGSAGGTRIRRSLLNERWFTAYTDSYVDLEFTPHATKRAIARGAEPEPGEVVSTRVELPPHPKPIATANEIALVAAVLDTGSSPPRRAPGSVFGAGLGQDEDEVEVIEVEL